jgi:putative transposase
MSTDRKFVFANDHYYHVFNRGHEKREIFSDVREYRRFLELLNYYRFSKPPLRFSKYMEINQKQRTEILHSLEKNNRQIVEVICYCLMPNHFHLLLKQLEKNGIAKFLAQVSNSYTKYFNTKHSRASNLFQGTFKAVHVESDEQLLHLSRYIHTNPITASLTTKPEEYLWSSYLDYTSPVCRSLVSPNIILTQFQSPSGYLKFVIDSGSRTNILEEIQHLSLD